MLERLASPPELFDRVYDSLLQAICSGELVPGERYTQEALAARLGVSRQPVLQALLLLRQQGLIRDTANRRGVVVTPLDDEFVVHLYAVRAALDGLAARTASAQCDAARASVGRDIVARGHAAAAHGDAQALARLDVEFHGFLYETSANPLLLDLARLHAHHTRRVIAASVREPAIAHTVWPEHEAILEAVIAGDADTAERRSREHAQRAAQLLSRVPAEPRPRRTQR